MDWLAKNIQFEPLDFSTKYALLILNSITILVLYFFKKKRVPPATRPNVLIVTAHPDDETMFFLPTILEVSQEHDVHLLCLSGDATRQRQLKTCVEYLGPKRIKNFLCVDKQKLKDGLKQKWDTEEIGNAVMEYIRQHDVKALFTFDKHGVSDHPNHKAINHALQEFVVKTKEEGKKYIKFYELQSVNIIRKYIGVLDSFFSLLADFTFTNLKVWIGIKALCLHKSQLVWYRRLFIVLSRYPYVNTYASPKLINITQ